MVEENKEISENNEGYINYIEELEEKKKIGDEKGLEKEKKLQREIQLLKRKLN